MQYYKQKANEELDKMEKNIQSGNKLSAINEKHWQTHTYPSLLPFNFFIDHTIISFKTNLLSNSYYQMFVKFDLHRTVGTTTLSVLKGGSNRDFPTI